MNAGRPCTRPTPSCSRLWLLTLLILPMSLLTACAPDRELDERGDPVTLRIADTGLEGMEELQRHFGPFRDAMEDMLGRPVEFEPVSDRTIATHSMEAGDVDIVLAGPTEYLFIRSRNQDVRPVAGIERGEYYSVFVTRRDAGIESLQDLAGRDVALKARGSTSGYVTPMGMLMDAGFDDPYDAMNILDIDADEPRYQSLIAGDIDAFAGGIRDWRWFEERGHDGDHVVLAQSDPLPADVFIVRGGLSDELVEEIRAAMLAHGDQIIDALVAGGGQMTKFRGARVIEADDSYFDGFRQVHQRLGLPFD